MCVMDAKSLSEQIEQFRSEMVELGSVLGLQHPKVIQLSTELDKLLLEYYASKK